jgi:hypothetical protein
MRNDLLLLAETERGDRQEDERNDDAGPEHCRRAFPSSLDWGFSCD